LKLQTAIKKANNYICDMGIIFAILLYAFSLVSLIKAARTGKGLFFPNFKRIDEVYFLGMKKVWSTWWGIMCYYFLLITHLSIFAFIIFCGIYLFFKPL